MILDKEMDAHFPLRTTVRKSTDKPWINKAVKRLARRKRKAFEETGRSAAWRELDRLSRDLIAKQAEEYMNTQRASMLGQDAGRNFYKNVRVHDSKEKPPDIDPVDLFPWFSDQKTSEALADHFTEIGRDFDGNVKIPQAPSAPLPVLSVGEVVKRLCDIKKPKGRVVGDRHGSSSQPGNPLDRYLQIDYTDQAAASCLEDRAYNSHTESPHPRDGEQC